MYRKQALVLWYLLIILILAAVNGHAFEWGPNPPLLAGDGDLAGEVVTVDDQELILALPSGELQQIPLGVDCQITLNGLSVEVGALAPVMNGHYVEVSVVMAAGRASRVQGFYYCIEAEIGAVKDNRILLKPLNFPGSGYWVLTSAESGAQPPLGSVCLVRLDSTGAIKQWQLLIS